MKAREFGEKYGFNSKYEEAKFEQKKLDEARRLLVERSTPKELFNESFLSQIKDVLESNLETEYYFDGHSEYPVDYFNYDEAAKAIYRFLRINNLIL